MSEPRKSSDFGCLITGMLVLVLLSGCSEGRAPSFLVLGSYFPAWLVGVAISIPLTIAIRSALIRTGIDDALPLRLLVYSCLCVLLTLAFTYAFSPR